MKAWEESLTADATWFFQLLAPPRAPLPLTQWAGTVRVPPDSPKAKNQAVRPFLNPREHHGQWCVLQVLEVRGFRTPSGRWVPVREVTIMACVQDGKSLVLDVWTAHSVLEEAVHFVSAYPDRELATKAWRAKLKPMIRGSGYGHLLPTTGPGSGDGSKPEDILFLSGGRLYLLGAGAANEAGQSAVTGERAKLDELDSMRPRFARLIANRTAAHGARRMLCKTSTLKHDDPRLSPTLQAWTRGTCGQFQYQCPQCQAWQPFEAMDYHTGVLRLVYDDTDDSTARASAAIRCLGEDCQHRITEAERRHALREYRLVMAGQEVGADGVVTGEPQITESWTLRWTATDSPLEKNLGDLAVEHKAALGEITDYGNHERMRQLVRDEFVCCYTADKERSVALSVAYLCKLSNQSTYQIGEVPSVVEWLTVGVDVQKYWLYWCVVGHRADGSHFLVAAGVENLRHPDGSELTQEDEPDPEHYWDALDRLGMQLATAFPRVDGRDPIVRRMLDLGYRLDALRPYLAGHLEWTGVVGRGDVQVLRQQGATTGNRVLFIPGVVDIRTEADGYGTWELWMLDSDVIKSQIHNGFLKGRGKPAAGYLPRGIEVRDRSQRISRDSRLAWIARHLTAEVRKRDEASGEVTWEKADGAGRHDLFDAYTYAQAGGLAHAQWLRTQTETPNATVKPADTRARVEPIHRRHSRIDRPRNRT